MIPILEDRDMVLVSINKDGDNFKVLVPNDMVDLFGHFIYGNKDKDIRDVIEEALTIFEGYLAFNVEINIREEQ